MLGDQFNGRNNPSEVIKDFVAFLERFKNKEVFIISGNHEKTGDGRTALDFLKEINNPNWHILTGEVFEKEYKTATKKETLVFCPYFFRSELKVKDYKTASEKIMRQMIKGDYLFTHQAISGLFFNFVVSTNNLDEIVLPKKELEKKYKRIFMGHLHEPQEAGKVTVAGSVFTNEVGEKEKFIYVLDTETDKVEKIQLPCRPIIKIEISEKSLDNWEMLFKNNYLPEKCIAKVYLNSKFSEEELKKIKTKLQKHCDAFSLIENYASDRKKSKLDGLELTTENLLKVYAEQKKVDLTKLMRGWELIKD